MGAAAGLADTQPLQTLFNSQADTSKHWCDPAPLSGGRSSRGGCVVVLVKSLKNVLIPHGGDGDDGEGAASPSGLRTTKWGVKWR